jgi:hypothetical protein
MPHKNTISVITDDGSKSAIAAKRGGVVKNQAKKRMNIGLIYVRAESSVLYIISKII